MTFLNSATTITLGAMLAVVSLPAWAATPQTATPQTATLLVVRHASTPAGMILQGVTVKPGATMLYLSGQLASPLDPTKKVAPADMTADDFGDTKTQTMSALTKIKTILAAQGYQMSDVIKLTVFVAGDPKLGGKMDFSGMNEAFKTFFGSADNPNTVARSTVQVAALAAPPFLVEVEATAAK